MGWRTALIVFVVTVVAGWGVQRLSYRYFVADEYTRADGRLSLYRSSLTAELEQFAPLIHVLARDRVVIDAAAEGEVERINPRLKAFSDEAGLDAIYFIRPDGITTAASNYDLPLSFIGEDYSFRPYFQQALAGERGRFYAIGATTGLPGYFLSEPVLSPVPARGLLGVIVLKISFESLKQTWTNAGEQVFLANADGVVILASDPAWSYRTLAPLTQAQREQIAQTRQFANAALDPLDWEPMPDRTARIGGETRLHLVSGGLPHGWELHFFSADDRAVARSWLVTAGFVLAAGGLLLLAQLQHARQVGAALVRSEREEAVLRRANEKLAVEIAERRQAEAELRRTQAELSKASRLAALGELSASVTHELGQPIAAMRNHLAAAEYGRGDAKVLDRLGALVARMEAITRQLKFFATPDPEPFERFDLRDAMKASLALLHHTIEAAPAELALALPETPVPLRGSRLRIEQVMTNLVRNALEATEEARTPRVEIAMGVDAEGPWFEVRDTGHGLGQSTLAELQEPFVTSRASGAGMGLGLAISANIVKDHDGTMTARNRAGEGAVFRVAFHGGAEGAALEQEDGTET